MSERSIFLAALDIADPAQRSIYLDQVCGGNAQLRRHIDDLIAAEAKLGGFLARPHLAPEVTADVAPALERPGTVIGPYKLLQVIGEGGMGVVYMAEQEQPVRRRVALKIIKPGMDSRQVIARFEAERQALAMMDHQNIAKVLDAGTTHSGLPYFVMELVHGVPLTKFCDDNRLSPRERLELFVPVCQAIQHAHQKGVIHRDIKPTNILVTMYDDKPVPKVIDFGVAKAVEQRLTEKTLFTQYGTLVGTFEYMSPEQAEMNAFGVDTRSDIYSLGVLLYELLTGTTPLERPKLREAALVEMVRMIKEDEPPRPSIRLSSSGTLPKFAAACRTEPARLSQLLRGELDWIVMKCLEKDRTRRYETASNLARDVQRYLKDEPVEACPPSLRYRISKVARRYKAPLAVAAGFVVLMFTGTTISIWQASRAGIAERAALVSEQRAREKAKAATQAQQSAVQEKNNALAAREELRETLYAAEMNLVQVAAEGKKYKRAAQLLDQQRPAAGQPDLRGFEWHYWQRKLQRGRLRSVEVPQLASGMGTRVFSRDATRLAVVDSMYQFDSRTKAGWLAVFDGVTGRELFSPFEPFPDPQPGASFNRKLLTMSEDGTRLAVAVQNRGTSHISIRDSGSGSEIRRMEFSGYLSDIKLTADGSRIAAAFYELEEPKDSRIGVNVWDTATGNLVRSLPMLPYFSGYVTMFNYRILWSPDGTRLLRQSFAREVTDNTGEYRTVIQIVDVASDGELWQREMPSHENPQGARSWSPDGKLLVICEAAGPGIGVKPNVQLWDSGTGTTLAILDLEATSSVHGESNVNFSSDGKRLAVVVGFNEINVWEVPELPLVAGARSLRIAATHLTLQNPGSAIQALGFSPDGRELRSVDGGTSIVTWDATARDETGLGPDGLSSPSSKISPDATKIAFQEDSSSQMCSVWDLTKNQEVCRLKSNAGVDVSLRVGGFSSDGRRVAIVSNPTLPEGESQIVIHDAQTGEVLKVIRVDKLDSTFPATIVNFEFRPDGRQIAALIGTRFPVQNQFGPAQLVAWDAATGIRLFSVATDVSTSRAALWYSFDGTSLMVAGPTGRSGEAAVFYDATTGERQRSISLPSSPGGYFFDLRHQMFGANVGSDFVLEDLATGQERLRLRGYNSVQRMAISPDCSRLVLSSGLPGGNSELTFWSLKSGRRLLALSLPYRPNLSFSPDGDRLVAALGGYRSNIKPKPIQVWDATPLPEEPETK